MALAGHSGIQTAQSMHSSGSITRKLGPSRKQSTGHTSTQSVYLHLIQFSVTTWVIRDSADKQQLFELPGFYPHGALQGDDNPGRRSGVAGRFAGNGGVPHMLWCGEKSV